jgi:hypothetical protein
MPAIVKSTRSLTPVADCHQGCQMVCFQTKNPNLGKFWRALEWKMLEYFMALFNILRSFGIFYGDLHSNVVIWCIFPRFGKLCQEKSGTPDCHIHQLLLPLLLLIQFLRIFKWSSKTQKIDAFDLRSML